MTRSLPRLLFAVLVLCLPHPRATVADTIGMVEAGERFAFPSGGHYRVGTYFPVRVTGSVNGRRVEARGVVRIKAAATGWTDAVVPVLAVGTIEQGGWSVQPLADDERLVGATTPDTALAAELFPGQRIVDVTLDLSNPLPGPPLAWGALDAVLLDGVAAARVTEGQLATLLAGGTVVAVRSEARPTGGPLPWRQRGAWWVTGSEAAARPDVVQPGRYAPVAGEPVGISSRQRRDVVLILAAFSLAAVAVSLWRSRRAWVAVVVLSGLAGACVVLWSSRQPTSVAVVTEARAGPWVDRWTRHVAHADGDVRHPIAASDAAVWPVFFSRRHAQDAALRLECGPDGTPQAFVARLKRGQAIAFLARSVSPVTPTPPAATSPAAPPR